MPSRSRAADTWALEVADAGECDSLLAARALALLARWATRRAQRIAKERSGEAAADCNRLRNKRLRPQDGEEQT
jgi:hypothetical protein